MHIYPEDFYDTDDRNFIKSLNWGKLEDYFEGGIHIACAKDYRSYYYKYRGLEYISYSLGWETDLERLSKKKRYDDLNVKRKKIIKDIRRVASHAKTINTIAYHEAELYLEFIRYYLDKRGVMYDRYRHLEEMGEKLRRKREKEKKYRGKEGNPEYRKMRSEIK